MRVTALLAALGFLAVPLRAGVETQSSEGRIRIEAHAAPLCDVLDDLARHTGMKVVYEGSPPREPVTATLERSTLEEALLAVFEGLGLTYVIQLDAAGTGVAKLVIVASGALAAGGAPAATIYSGPRPGRMGASALPEPAEEPEPDPLEPELGEDVSEVNDPATVMRDRVVTDPGSGEAYPFLPDIVPEEPTESPIDGGVPGDASGDGVLPEQPTPFMRIPQPRGLPSPRPRPSPGAP